MSVFKFKILTRNKGLLLFVKNKLGEIKIKHSEIDVFSDFLLQVLLICYLKSCLGLFEFWVKNLCIIHTKFGTELKVFKSPKNIKSIQWEITLIVPN